MNVTTRVRALVVGTIAVGAVLLGWLAVVQSPVYDETAHLAAGISHWRYGRFDLYAVNPPLVRTVAAAPVVLAGAETDFQHWRSYPADRSEFPVGRDFVVANGERSFWLFTLARWALIPIVLLGGWICWRWGRELGGDAGGLIALALWCFSPHVLANGSLMTPDGCAAVFGILAAYAFRAWLREPRWERALLAGAALGLAELTKFTWIVLFPLWPLLWLAHRWPDRRELGPRGWLREAGQGAGMLLVGLWLINAGYGFEGTGTRLGRFEFVSRSLGGERPDLERFGNRFADSWIGQIPVPLPRNYLLGIDVQKRDFEGYHPVYLRGELRDGGFWYYYLYALAVKVPLGTWGLFLLAVWYAVARRRMDVGWREHMLLLVPAAVLLALVSWNCSVAHFRYLLPAFPFVFVWIGRLGRLCGEAIVWPRYVVGGLLAYAVGSSLWYVPHSGAYFNELAGGPRNGGRHLLGSAIDWGQNLLHLRRWLVEHPEVELDGLVYVGNMDPAIAGLDAGLPPDEPRPGWYAVSVCRVSGGLQPVFSEGRTGRPPAERWAWFRDHEPVARVGYGMFVYRIE